MEMKMTMKYLLGAAALATLLAGGLTANAQTAPAGNSGAIVNTNETGNAAAKPGGKTESSAGETGAGVGGAGTGGMSSAGAAGGQGSGAGR